MSNEATNLEFNVPAKTGDTGTLEHRVAVLEHKVKVLFHKLKEAQHKLHNTHGIEIDIVVEE